MSDLQSIIFPTYDANNIADLQYKADEAITSWLGTTASQIFFMQLGFLCYEVGFVNPVWAPSIILKNIEDTFVGILTYISFTHTLATSSPSIYGIISVPNQPFLVAVDPSLHEEVFVASVFATTCATIISGAVLERMKNKAYIFWCFLVLLINYSFVAHWVWHPDGWLAKLGFMDGAGAVVVHSTGAVAAWVAVRALGPRRGSVLKDGSLKEVETAARPIINAIGAFILWYGWFAFNISSPVAADLRVGDALGTTALVTCIAPTMASSSALLLMYWDFAKLSYDNLLGALLAGLISITGCCYTVNIWEAAAVGFFSAPVFFLSQYLVRHKLRIDDPLQIIPIHGFTGVYSVMMEGVFANDVMGNPGLVYGNYSHFGVQVLGALVITLFNMVVCLFLWYVVLERVLFRKTSIKVSILDTYLGVSLFELNNTMALEEVLENKSNLAKQMSFQFHNYTVERFNNEQYDFLVAIHVFRDLVHHEKDPLKIAKAMISMVQTYILPSAPMCVNVSGTQRSQLIKIRNQLQFELIQLQRRQDTDRSVRSVDTTASDKNQLERLERLERGASGAQSSGGGGGGNANGVGVVTASGGDSEIYVKYSNKDGINATNEVEDSIDVPTYLDDGSVDFSSQQRMYNRMRNGSHMQALRAKRGSSLLNKDVMSDKIFDVVHSEVFKVVLPVFSQFLRRFDKKRDCVKESVRLPFQLLPDWQLEWDEELKKKQSGLRAGSLSQAAAASLKANGDESVIFKVQESLHLNHKSGNLPSSANQAVVTPSAHNYGSGMPHTAPVTFVIHEAYESPKENASDGDVLEEENKDKNNNNEVHVEMIVHDE